MQHNFGVPRDRYLRVDGVAAMVVGEPFNRAVLWTRLAGVQTRRELVPDKDSDGLFYRYPAKGRVAPYYVDKGEAAHLEITRVYETYRPTGVWGYYILSGCVVDKLPSTAVIRQNGVRPISNP